MIWPDCLLNSTRFFQEKHLIQFLSNKMQDFRNFVRDNSILNFDADQVYLKLQLANVKDKEVTANNKLQT